MPGWLSGWREGMAVLIEATEYACTCNPVQLLHYALMRDSLCIAGIFFVSMYVKDFL